MGTNYYTIKNYCDCCKRFDKDHIGKSSAGWTFSFQSAYNINDYDEWVENIKSAEKIVDEYGNELTVSEMIEIVESKKNNIHNFAKEHPGHGFVDKYGNSFTVSDFS